VLVTVATTVEAALIATARAHERTARKDRSVITPRRPIDVAVVVRLDRRERDPAPDPARPRETAAFHAAERALHAFATVERLHLSTFRNTLLLHVPSRPGSPLAPRRIGEIAQAAVEKDLGERPWIGVSVVTGAHGAAEAVLREARQAVDLGRRLWESPRVIEYTDVLAVVAVGADRTTTARLAQLLAPLVSPRKPKRKTLLTALETFFAYDMSPTEAARALGVHRHTLDYRLARAEQLLGRSVRRGSDRFLIEAALIARRLSPPASDLTRSPGETPPQPQPLYR
jgi:hypothetical protein